VVKYRKQLLQGEVGDYVKLKIIEIASRSEFDVEEIEVDKDHTHILLTISPAICAASYVRGIKQSTTQSLWNKFRWLKKQFWLEKHSGRTAILFARLAMHLPIQFGNTFKNKVSYSDSSHRHRFASINGFSRIISINSRAFRAKPQGLA
jgi:putative transposase